MNAELLKAINKLNENLDYISGEVLRAKSTNVTRLFTQDLLLDNTTSKESPNASIEFPFKSIVINDGTDENTYVYAIFDRSNLGKQAIKMKLNSSYVFDQQVSGVTLYSPAQPGKKLTVSLSSDGVFTPGSLINSGLFSIKNPTTRILSNPAISAATATKILSIDASRKRATIENRSGASIWLGVDNTVTNAGATRGIELTNGSQIEDANTGELWIYSVGAISAGGLTIISET